MGDVVRFSKVMRALIAGLTGLTLGLVIVLVILRRVDRIYELGEVFPPLSGYSIDMQYVPAADGRCRLIRVTADNCPYCRADQDQYAHLVEQARRAGCQVATIGPRAGDVALQPEADIVQLQYVDMRFGRALDPFGTPQTILLDTSGRVVWHRQGPLREHDRARATGEMAELK